MKFSVKLKCEEALKVFSKLIPRDVLKEAEKRLGSPDFEAFFNEKVKPLIEDYMRKILNFNLNDGEEVLWVHEVKRGLIHKETVEKWIITNLRAIKFYPETKDRPKPEMNAIGHIMADVVVMNQHRKSTGDRVGTFTGSYRYGLGVGAGYARTHTESRTYGDLVFLVAGREAFRFPGVSDPHGVKKLIETLKKA